MTTGAFGARPFNASPFNAGDSFTDTVSGTIALSGTATEGLVYTDIVSGTIALSGTATDGFVFDDVVSGTVPVTGAATDSYQSDTSTEYTDVVSGTITIGGTCTDEYLGPLKSLFPPFVFRRRLPPPAKIYVDHVHGHVDLSGSVLESHEAPDPELLREEELILALA